MPAWIGLALSAASAGAGIIGGMQSDAANQDAADARAKYAKKDWERSNRERTETFRWAKRQVELQEYNDENFATYKDTVAKQTWAQKMRIQDFDYASKVRQFNASEQQYAQQVDYNAISATLARDEQALWLEEQLKRAGFDREGLILDTNKKLEDIGFDYEQVALQLGEARDVFSTTRQGINLQQQITRAKTSFDIQQNQIKGLQNEGKARAMGQAGRTGRKNQQSALAMAGLQQAALVDALTRSDSAYDLQRLQNTQKYGYQRRGAALKEDRLGAMAEFTKATSELGHRKIAATMESAYDKNKANLLRIEHDQYGADMAAHNNRMAAPERLPDIPKPFETPRTVFMHPRLPEKLTRPQGAVNLGNPGMWSGIASGLGSIGSYVGTPNMWKD